MSTARVSRVSVGRVYNLGNYEHVRYEITVDIPGGESATRAIIGVERILAGMKPIKDEVHSAAQIAHASGEISRMKEATDDVWQRNWGHCTGTREEVIARYENSFAETMTKRAAAIQRAKYARLLFDSLHGAEQFKDAKLDWDDDQDY